MNQAQRIARSLAVQDTPTPVLITTKRHADSRGWFSESYSRRALESYGITCEFVQDNQSMSLQKGTIRGLHFQTPPMAQAKLVRVLRGSILDVAVDVRRDSPSYGAFVAVELSADEGDQLFVPTGFAHGFCTLEDNTEVAYKVTEYYSPQHDGGIRWDDPQMAIPWPVALGDAVVSAKDASLPLLGQWRSAFPYDGAPLAPLQFRARS